MTTDDLLDDHAEPGSDSDQEKHRVRRDIADLQWVMADARGRRFVARLLDFAGVNRTVFSTNGSMMNLNEGRRQVGLFLTHEMLTHCPKSYFQLIHEYRNDDRNR